MSTQDHELIEAAFATIDAANACDPRTETLDGETVAKELLYGQRMSAMLRQFDPRASTALAIAARAQHIERWKSPRSDYPEGRAGYKKWRANLGLFHANRVSEILDTLGAEKALCERVAYIVQKRGLKRDPETQTLEDVICLVFLAHYADEFVAKHSDDKVIDILQKTWSKMSDKGQSKALTLSHSKKILGLIQRALA